MYSTAFIVVADFPEKTDDNDDDDDDLRPFSLAGFQRQKRERGDGYYYNSHASDFSGTTLMAERGPNTITIIVREQELRKLKTTRTDDYVECP